MLKTALTRGSFEYQGQKCSASSRAYIPRSIWDGGFKEEFAAEVDGITMGDVTDLTNFIGAVIDERAFAKNKAAIDRAKADPTSRWSPAARTTTRSAASSARPCSVSTDPENEIFREEYFGPVLGVYVYDDADYDAMLDQMESVSDYALTGSVIARDRAAAAHAMEKLRYAAGNFYINDKSTGAVVGQQPFGGGRASGTNDKAGAAQNLMRWTLHPRHQGDAGPADRLPLPAPGLSRAAAPPVPLPRHAARRRPPHPRGDGGAGRSGDRPSQIVGSPSNCGDRTDPLA